MSVFDDATKSFAMSDFGTTRGSDAVWDLPVSSHTGPALNLLWSAKSELTVDQQLGDASAEHHKLKDQQAKLEEQILRSRAPTQMNPRSKPRGPPRNSNMKDFKPGEAMRHLKLKSDPRYQTLLACVKDLGKDGDEADDEVATVNFGAEAMRQQHKQNWRHQFQQNVRGMIDDILMTPSPELQERQLAEAHSWCLQHRGGGTVSNRIAQEDIVPTDEDAQLCPDFNNFMKEERPDVRQRPGSAFYVPPPDGDRLGFPGDHSSSLVAGEKPAEVAGRPVQQVQLPPAKDRLKDFKTRQLIGPLTARRLKAAEAGFDAWRDDACSPEPYERPLTPSTATGGYTSRSGVTSARSTPTPFGSRPASAASSVARPGLARPFRPTSAMSLASQTSHGTNTVGGLPHTLEEGYIVYENGHDVTLAPYPATEAEQKMEERWMARRNREIVNQVVAGEQRALVHNWAERRARVEEEMARNCEAARYQSDLQKRSYLTPPDAEEDIQATVPEGEVKQQDPEAALRAKANRGQEKAPRFDCSNPATNYRNSIRTSKVAFTVEKPAPKKKAALNARIAHLRQVHAGLISDAELQEEEQEQPEGDDEGLLIPALLAKQKEAAAVPSTLSAYACDDKKNAYPRMEDDSDALISVCDWWQAKHGIEAPTPGDGGLTLDEIRFSQLKEVEEIKRVFARKGVPINVATLQRALVTPVHRLTPGVPLFNQGPNLMKHPFMKNEKAKKKAKKGSSKGKGKAKAAAKSSGGKSKSPKPKKKS
eukprot:TRINITY_DN109171_c0_g1_i1.p1 TRINITY_DN109171_c0_g1~~TRINITY_DN109171_c0_g1_i1.p1  ORF type:complete len:762 (+),score=169.30 TRINITY_DN109171_c0_g1_i1:40-2325(+)